eukprot:2082622-Pleurochrysis_carterae.AAC.1
MLWFRNFCGVSKWELNGQHGRSQTMQFPRGKAARRAGSDTVVKSVLVRIERAINIWDPSFWRSTAALAK